MRTVAFLDANVLAKPFTRTLLLVGARALDARYRITWSQRAEEEAQRALERRFKGRAQALSVIRDRRNFDLSPSGVLADRFGATDESDRQILADAVAAKALILVTEDIDDFAAADLDEARVSAVHYDLFAASFLSPTGYRAALDVMARGIATEKVHAAVARLHPRLFAVFADEFPSIDPLPYSGELPGEVIRGGAWTPPATSRVTGDSP